MKGLKYFAEYSDFDGQEYKIEIWVEGFTGVATEVTAGGNPVTVDRNKDVSETYLGGIVPTFYRFEFVTDTNFSTRVFDSEKYGDVVIQHYKGTNLQFNAIVQPFIGMEQDLPDGLSVFTLSAECGLEYLKNKKFANPTDTNVRLIDLVQEAVDLIPYVEKFGFKVFDNTALYNGVSRINSNQNFLEARINRKTFTDYTYYDVLLNLVANRNEIYFDNGYWWVRNLSELSELYTTSNTGTLVTYDENGDFLTSIPNYRPSKSIIRQAGGSFGKLFSQKNVVVKRIEPERINYVLNGSFNQGSTNFVPNNWTAGSEAFSSVLGADFFRFVESVYTPTLTSDNAYIQSTAITWEPFGAFFATPVREPQKLTFRTNVEIGTGISACRFQIIATIGGSPFYLTSDLAWTTTPTVMQKKPDASGQIEFDIPQPPNQGFTNLNNFDVPVIYNVSMRLFRSERAFETAVSTATYFTQYNEVSFFKDSLYTQFFDEYIGKSDYRQDENSDRENPLELETIIASQNSFPYRHGSLFDSEGLAANGFGSVNSIAGTIYNIYLATSYLNVTSKRLTYYQGSSFEHFDFSDVLLIDGIHFRVSNYSHDIKSKTVQFKAVELSYSSGFVLDVNKIKSDVEKAITVVNNIGVIPQDYNFTSSTNFDGRTSFGMRPDVRHVSASLTEMFLRAEPSAADSVSIKPGVDGIELLTPPPIGAIPETLATREWAASGLETKYIQLDTTYTNGNFQGRLSWDADHDLMFLGLEDDYTAKLPQDSVWSCIAAEAITKGQLVYASGTSGTSGKIQASRFIANGTIPSRFVIGVATRTVAQGETFHALRAGVLRGLDTSAYSAGQDLWASSTVAGGYQTTSPSAPNPKMSVAFVITSHAQVGELAVRIAPSVGLSLLDDVQLTSPTSGQILRHTGTRWENFTHDFASVPTAGTVNRIPRFTAGRTLADSVLFQNNSDIGIGQLPSARFDITGASGFTILKLTRTNPGVGGGLGAVGFGDVDGYKSGITSFYSTSTTTQTDLRFHTGLTAALPYSITERMRITAGGNILVNTTVDGGERLQVNGSARITGATSILGTLTVPTIGNSAGVSAQNTWTFASNVNVPLTPSASTHATSKSYVDNLVATGIKEGIPVRSISLTNITLSGTQTVSGVALVAGDRVLVAGQTTASQNGVYVVAAGTWSRATDSDTDLELRGYQYLITAGTFINAKYRNTNESAITVGTTAITYVVSQGAETDPIFSASPAAGITDQFITNWNANYAIWGLNTPDSIFAARSTSDLAEGTRLYYTDVRARAAISAGTGIGYNTSTGVITNLITQYTDAMARAALSFAAGSAGYNSTTGVISIPTTSTHISEGTNLFYTDTRSRGALSFVAGSGAYNNTTGVITIPTQTSHLTNNSGFITSATLSGYVPTTRTINGLDLSVNRVLTTSNIGEGTNLYFTNARSRAALSFIAGVGNYNSGTGAITIPTNTNHVAEGSNLYFTNARARTAMSLTTSGTSGLATYNSSTGVLNIPNYTITNPITGILTAGRIPVATAAGVLGNSNVFQSGVNIGIGTTTAESLLNIAGSSGVSILKLTRTNPATQGGIGFIGFGKIGDYTAGISSFYGSINTDSSDLRFHVGIFNTNPYLVQEVARLTATGEFLINGTISTGERLQVNGSAKITSMAAGGDLDSIVSVTSSGVLTKIPNILTNKQFTDVASGLRQLRSIDYYESRMDFGFDKVLDVPYLYYDKNGTRYVNYMNGNGVFVHVDASGNEREYVRKGDVVWTVPNLQQISEEGNNSTVRLQFNGIDYATLEDITSAGGTPNLQQVAVQGNNASIRLQFNGVNYATVNDIVASTTPNLQQVSQQGANSTIRLQFNGVNYATVNDIGSGGTTPNLSQVLAVGNNAGTTPILFGSNAFLQGVEGSLFMENTGSIFIRANGNNSRINLDTTGAQIISGASFVRADPATSSVQIAGLLTKFKIDLTANIDGVPYAFHQVPGTLTAGAKYVFLWDGSKFIIVNA